MCCNRGVCFAPCSSAFPQLFLSYFQLFPFAYFRLSALLSSWKYGCSCLLTSLSSEGRSALAAAITLSDPQWRKERTSHCHHPVPPVISSGQWRKERTSHHPVPPAISSGGVFSTRDHWRLGAMASEPLSFNGDGCCTWPGPAPTSCVLG